MFESQQKVEKSIVKIQSMFKNMDNLFKKYDETTEEIANIIKDTSEGEQGNDNSLRSTHRSDLVSLLHLDDLSDH
jgi:uncharacterized phage infection (PIP) family protein YhgE